MFALTALFTAGCERAFFGFVNRGTPPPSETAVFAPEKNLSLDVYRAQGGAADAPVVVFFYGGAWKRGERGQYAFVGSRLAQNGVLAIVPDYRTYPGATFPGFMADAAQAVAWARANAARYGGDPSRVYLAGHSAGAQIAGLLGTDAQYLARVDVALDDIAGVIGLSGPYDFIVGEAFAPIFGPPSQHRDAMAVNFVNGDEPPFLLIHGKDDTTVEARDSIEMHAKLRANGVESRLLLLPDAGHFAPAAAFYDPGRAPGVLPAVLDFLGAARPVASSDG